MNDTNSDHDLTADDERLVAVLDRLNAASTAGEEPWNDLDPVERELLGTLATALDPAAMAPELRRRVMEEVAADAASAPTEAAPGALVDDPDEVDDPGPAVADQRSRGAWLLPLAAVLALALFGLSGWQYLQIERQQVVIDRLSVNLASAIGRAEAVGELEGEMVESRAKLAMMTEPGVEFCLLKPVEESPEFAGARATMVVSAGRDGWYLRAQGLEPVAPGRTYRVWWLTEEGPVPAGAFDGAPEGAAVELSDSRVPESVRGIAVTVEPESGAGEPSGPRVLYADEAMRLL